jgi:hypothetical protein
MRITKNGHMNTITKVAIVLAIAVIILFAYTTEGKSTLCRIINGISPTTYVSFCNEPIPNVPITLPKFIYYKLQNVYAVYNLTIPIIYAKNSSYSSYLPQLVGKVVYIHWAGGYIIANSTTMGTYYPNTSTRFFSLPYLVTNINIANGMVVYTMKENMVNNPTFVSINNINSNISNIYNTTTFIEGVYYNGTEIIRCQLYQISPKAKLMRCQVINTD